MSFNLVNTRGVSTKQREEGIDRMARRVMGFAETEPDALALYEEYESSKKFNYVEIWMVVGERCVPYSVPRPRSWYQLHQKRKEVMQ